MNYGGIDNEFTDFVDSKIAVLPVPYDGTSTWIKGADKGPDAILEASANMELYDIETNSEVYKLGIFTADPVTENSSPEKMSEAVYEEVTRLIRHNKFVVTLGGEHSISIGAILSHVEHFKDVTVLQIDAHTDLRPEYEGSKYNHACVMARTRDIAPYVQVGIRSMDTVELPYIVPGNIFYAEDIRKGIDWMDAAIAKLSSNVYLTFDLDGLDPSIMASTGTPEPGGLYWNETIQFLKKVIDQKNLIGFDVVELCPNKVNKAPNFLASKLIYKLLSYQFQK
ncbi:MAG TPA: agmatinase [Bacteroidales bacterium]|nr:agmatinase [Bacteroidales bacterium]HRX98037.1 agmatinase [Bacteroidales bacterium]